MEALPPPGCKCNDRMPILEKIVHGVVKDMPPDDFAFAKDFLQDWANTKGVWVQASICSGSEFAYLIDQYLKDAFDVNLPSKHRMVLEWEGWKRNWIDGHFDVDILGGDAQQLLSGKMIDFKTGLTVDVPDDIDGLDLGFSCKKISSLGEATKFSTSLAFLVSLG